MKPVTPKDLALRANRLYERSARAWVSGTDDGSAIDAPLHPPTERDVLTDADAAVHWVHAWRRAAERLPITVTWEERSWSRIGRQSVPVRAAVSGAAAIAAVAGRSEEWKAWSARIDRLADAVAMDGARRREFSLALRAHARSIAGLDEADALVLQQVMVWLAGHPVSGLRVRQVPVRGVHTKWLERHRAIVEALVGAATGMPGLGLLNPSDRLRLLVLDDRWRPAGLRDITAPVGELAAMSVGGLRAVVIVENLETLLALPDTAGVVAIHGGGYRAHLAAMLPWVRSARVIYWGDLDSHGFAILNRLRATGVPAQSVLMDVATLDANRDQWVSEPKPFHGELGRLTEDERRARELLAEYGHVRLEQERIPWDRAWATLTDVLSRDSSTRHDSG